MTSELQRDSTDFWISRNIAQQRTKPKTGNIMRPITHLKSFLATAALTLAGGAATAQEVSQELEFVGVPIPAGVGFQPAATKLASDLQWLDGMLLVIITIISLFVTGLLLWVIFRYNRKSNPTPATFTHHSALEVTWTVVPIAILVFIGAFSLPVLFDQQEIPEGDINIKVTGYQWYWGYEYTDENVAFDSFMLAKEELAEFGYEDEHYLLATDTSIVIPVGKTIVMDVTGADVIHS